jgi:hypothetical protein
MYEATVSTPNMRFQIPLHPRDVPADWPSDVMEKFQDSRELEISSFDAAAERLRGCGLEYLCEPFNSNLIRFSESSAPLPAFIEETLSVLSGVYSQFVIHLAQHLSASDG